MSVTNQAKALNRELVIIKDMLEYLEEKGGFSVKSIWDGEVEVPVKDINGALFELSNVDYSKIYFTSRYEAFVAGNITIIFDRDMEPGESISDWTIPADGEFGHWMDQFTQEIYSEDGKYHG